MEETKPTPFQSPVPFFIKFRNLIFGKTKPDIYTSVAFYMNTLIWLSFTLWHLISYFTIASRNLILQQKGISVESIIQKRGVALGFEGREFLDRLMTYHAISIICWTAVFIGLILLYRKKRQFVYFVMGGTIFYLGMTIFYISYTYFIEDTTMYDKIALLIVIVSTLMHAYFMKNERSGGSINFFGEPEDEEAS